MAELSSASLEELLETAETAVAGRTFSARPLIVALVTTVVLLLLVSLALALASGGQLGKEARLLELVAPAYRSVETYINRLRLNDTHTRFHETPFGRQEIHVTGELENAGDRVLGNATLLLTLEHVFRDESYQYTFPLATPSTEGVGQPGPLLARSRRTFHYRVPDFPTDVTPRDVRAHWEIRDIQLADRVASPGLSLEPLP